MKISLLIRLTLGLLLVAVSTRSPAQTHALQAPELGYWNIETNLTTRDYTIVRFYDGQDQLVYEERLPGICLDLRKGNGLCRRTARQLTATLRQVLRESAGARLPTLLAQQFSQSRRLQRAYAVR